LFPTPDGLIAAECLSDAADLNPDFLPQVAELVEAPDLAFVLKRLGIRVEMSPEPAVTSQPKETIAKRPSQHSPAIAKWRSAERNALEYIKVMDTVLGVSDVSQANLGHDLDVMMKSGRRILVEVKSVTSFSEPFRLTSNEYATASSSRPDYVLALVVNAEKFDIRFVIDPVSVLSFERRCERWSWQCSDYNSAVNAPEHVFSIPGRALE
jgi:hypothetical protein